MRAEFGPPMTSLRVLGPLEVIVNGEGVHVRRGRPRRLLLALVVAGGRSVSTDTLIDELWGDDLPKSPANALQILVSYLRKTCCGPDGGGLRIDTSAIGYRLVVPRDAVDAWKFERLVSSLADAAHPRERLRIAEEALALWRGDALADATYESFAQPAISRLRELRISALATRAQALLDLGLEDVVLGDLRSLVYEHPLDERFHGQLIVALYRTGRQAEALRAYDHARRGLVDGLGIEPTPQLQSLARDVLAHAVTLQPLRVTPHDVADDSPIPRVVDHSAPRVLATAMTTG